MLPLGFALGASSALNRERSGLSVRLATPFLAAFIAFAGDVKLSPELRNADPESTLDVIVQFRQTPSEREHKKITSKGGLLKRELSVIRAGSYSIKARALPELATDPDVSGIYPDREVRGAMDVSSPTVNASIANANTWKGTGIGVAVIDSGIDGPDLSGKVVYSQNFVAGETDAKDHYGHGTHIAGILAGNGYKSGGRYAGIAQGVRLINLRVLDAHARGTDSAVIAAVQQAINLRVRYNIRVINLSSGGLSLPATWMIPCARPSKPPGRRASSWW